ncbi:hypothetical protein [Limosilactobacillus fermentum]
MRRQLNGQAVRASAITTWSPSTADDDDFAGAKYITYAFAFHDGQPVALVDQQLTAVKLSNRKRQRPRRLDRLPTGRVPTYGSTSTSANSSSSAWVARPAT